MSNLTMPFLLSNLEKHIKTGWNHLFSGHFYKKLTRKPIQSVKMRSTPSTTPCTRWPVTKPATARRLRACWIDTSANNANSSTSAVLLTSKLRSYVHLVRACAIFCRALHLHHRAARFKEKRKNRDSVVSLFLLSNYTRCFYSLMSPSVQWTT